MVAYPKQKRKEKKIPKVDNEIKGLEQNKQAHAHFKPESYHDQTPVWSFKRMKRENKWVFDSAEFVCISVNRQMESNCVLSMLAEYEDRKWSQIKQETHGKKNKSKHHFIEDLTKLDKEAKDRLEKLGIYEDFFSLRLNNLTRIYGVLRSRVFEILWYDNNHEIYPIDK